MFIILVFYRGIIPEYTSKKYLLKISKGLTIALLVQELRWFCFVGEFFLLVELQREMKICFPVVIDLLFAAWLMFDHSPLALTLPFSNFIVFLFFFFTKKYVIFICTLYVGKEI